MVLRKLILLMFGISWLIFSGYEVAAQEKQGANWMFGTKFFLNFNTPKPTVSNFSFADTIANGVATISDKNGNLLFFSSGGRVATRLKVNGVYQEMPNGNITGPLLYNKTTYAEMIVQSPADSNIYYLFFTGFGHRAALSRLRVVI